MLDHLIRDQYRRQSLWKPAVLKGDVVAHLELDIKDVVAAEVVAPKKEMQMANTGARGFAAILKARAEAMRNEFSKLADEINGEFDAQDNLLAEGKNQHAEMKKDTAELREALGMGNNPPA